MNTKCAIFVFAGSVLAMAIFCSSTIFVYAGTMNCYHSGERYICVHVFDNVQPPVTAVVDCDQDGKNCTVTWLDKATVPTPEAKNIIKNAQIEKFGKEISGDLSDTKIDNSPKPNAIPPSLAK